MKTCVFTGPRPKDLGNQFGTSGRILWKCKKRNPSAKAEGFLFLLVRSHLSVRFAASSPWGELACNFSHRGCVFGNILDDWKILACPGTFGYTKSSNRAYPYLMRSVAQLGGHRHRTRNLYGSAFPLSLLWGSYGTGKALFQLFF